MSMETSPLQEGDNLLFSDLQDTCEGLFVLKWPKYANGTELEFYGCPRQLNPIFVVRGEQSGKKQSMFVCSEYPCSGSVDDF